MKIVIKTIQSFENIFLHDICDMYMLFTGYSAWNQ